MVQGCHVLYCTHTNEQRILWELLVRCAVLSFQQRTPCRSLRLVHSFYCEASVRIGLRYFATCQAVSKTKKENARRGRLIRFKECRCRRSESCFFGHLLCDTARWYALGVCYTCASPQVPQRRREVSAKLNCLRRHTNPV